METDSYVAETPIGGNNAEQQPRPYARIAAQGIQGQYQALDMEDDGLVSEDDSASRRGNADRR